MGTWPEFQKCCGVIPLKTGTIVIGALSLVTNLSWIVYLTVLLALGIWQVRSPPLDDASAGPWTKLPFELDALGFTTISTLLAVRLFEAALAVVVIVGINKSAHLRRVVYFMTMLWLLSLLTSLVTASRDSFYDSYINAINLLISAYFILIIRSTYLELEGRLEEVRSEFSARPRSYNSDSFMAFHNPAFQPPPPNYDEAVRSAPTSSLTDLTLTRPNEILTDDLGERHPMTAVLPVVEQTMISPGVHQRRPQFGTPSSKDETTDETQIHAVGQLSATRNLQVADRCQISTSGNPRI